MDGDLLSNGTWECCSTRPGAAADPAALASLPVAWIPATVPGTAAGALRAAGEPDVSARDYDTDDWWFHSWYRGSRAVIAVTILPRVFVQGTVMFQRRLDLPTTLNRITVDLVKMF